MRRVSLVVLLSFIQPLYAVPHVRPETYPNAKPCHAKHLTPEMIKKYGSPRAAIISTATGVKRIAVILVQFPSANTTFTTGPANGAIASLATFDSYFSAMSAFYTEASFGQISLQFRFFGSGTPAATPAGSASAVAAGGGFTLANPIEYYGCGDVDPGCSGITSAPSGFGGAYLIHDALVASRTATTGPISGSIAGTFDGVLVMHAGYGNETTGKNGDIWSAFYQEPAIIGANGTTFVDGATFPELESSGITSPLGVMCHEFGHMLTLPDLYNTAVFGGSSVVGKWDLMDAGPYLANGTNPAHFGAWCKTYLSWATPQVASSRGSFSINPIETGAANSIIKMPVQNGGALEYFLLEYRSKTAGSYDQQIPGTGLLIWHIDDAITSARGFSATDLSLQNTINTGNPHYGISLVTADGLTISNGNLGTAGNAFTNTANFISPKSDNFSGQPSGVSVVKIAGVGGATATFEIVNLAVTASQTITKLINYPNPAGKGYPHPSGEGHTTIQFHLGRPAADYQLNIYTLSGDLVRKIDKSEINLNTDRSADDKWVYEYDWDFKNGNGQHVAPGVYLYLVRADGQSKSSKAVLIR